MSSNSTLEEVLVTATTQANNSVPPGRDKARTIADSAHDRGPPDPFLHLVDSAEVGGGPPKAPKKQGKVFAAP